MDVDGYNGTELANVDNKNSALLNPKLTLAESMDYLEGQRKLMQRENDYSIKIIGADIETTDKKESADLLYTEQQPTPIPQWGPDESMPFEKFESKANVTTTTKKTVTTEEDDEDEDEDDADSTIILFGVNSFKGVSMVAFFVTIWILLGFAGLITSIVCFGFSGSLLEKLLGILIAIFLGPFYWLYFYFNKGYCGRSGSRDSSRNRRR